MDNILFIGCLYSEQEKAKYLSRSKRGYQFAAQNFQEALLQGLLENGEAPAVVTVPALSTFPGGYKSPVVSGCDFTLSGKKMGRSIGFLNLPFLNACLPAMNSTIQRWGRENKGRKYAIVYGAHSHLMSAAAGLKRSFDDVKLCLIVPDLPKYMACNSLYKRLGLKKRDLRQIDGMLPAFDAVAVLSRPMADELGFADRPHTTVEGIYSGGKTIAKRKEKKTILYTGGLAMRYGIGDLVDAFMLIGDADYRLWLCGNGDAVPYIKECAAKDKRIEYNGVLPKEEATALQSEATLLVNPRHSNEVFTQYSFPSKTMEYLASGTPTVMCHLACIPQEYDEHLYYFEDESVEGMAKRMQELCGQDEETLAQKGEKAASFILREKNAKTQAGKILDLLKQL